jgi:hypothetical protein
LGKFITLSAGWAEIWPRSTPLVTLSIMELDMDRREKRSQDREEALQYLIEALADRSEVQAVLLVDDEGRIVAGMGMPREVRQLAGIAIAAVRGDESELFEAATRDTDFFGREIPVEEGSLYLVALGTRVCKMHQAVYGVTRILAETRASRELVAAPRSEQSVA